LGITPSLPRSASPPVTRLGADASPPAGRDCGREGPQTPSEASPWVRNASPSWRAKSELLKEPESPSLIRLKAYSTEDCPRKEGEAILALREQRRRLDRHMDSLFFMPSKPRGDFGDEVVGGLYLQDRGGRSGPLLRRQLTLPELRTAGGKPAPELRPRRPDSGERVFWRPPPEARRICEVSSKAAPVVQQKDAVVRPSDRQTSEVQWNCATAGSLADTTIGAIGGPNCGRHIPADPLEHRRRFHRPVNLTASLARIPSGDLGGEPTGLSAPSLGAPVTSRRARCSYPHHLSI